MRTMELQQPHPATLVTEDHQVLPSTRMHWHVLQRQTASRDARTGADTLHQVCQARRAEFPVFRGDLIAQIPTVRAILQASGVAIMRPLYAHPNCPA